MKRKKNQTTTASQKWEVLFSRVNELAVKALGEREWATIVTNADEQMKNLDIAPTNERQLVILAAGLYLGSVYGKALPRECQCPHMETK